MKMTAPVGNGLGKQTFSIKPSGIGLQMGEAIPPAPVAPLTPETPETPTPTPEPAVPQTPFNRLFPGVDPATVKMGVDKETGKILFNRIERAPEDPPESRVAAETGTPASLATSEPDTVAQLRAEIAAQNQIMTAMLQAQITGRPLAEILSGRPAAPAEPDYSGYDLYDDDQRVAFVRQVRADAIAAATAEAQTMMSSHLPSIQKAQQHGEFFAVQVEHGKDPDFDQKVALTNQLIGNNPNIPFKATYDLISQIQKSLAPAKPSTPEPVKQNGTPVLTQAQADAKAAQAARYQSTNGGRAVGVATPPPEIAKDFKKLAAWVAHQQMLGNLP